MFLQGHVSVTNLMLIRVPGGIWGPYYTFRSWAENIGFLHETIVHVDDLTQEVALACAKVLLDFSNELIAAGFPLQPCQEY